MESNKEDEMERIFHKEVILGIDPGITKTGIVVFNRGDNNEILDAIVQNKTGIWWETFKKIRSHLSDIHEEYDVRQSFIEIPVVYYRGGNKVVNQCLFVGAILECLYNIGSAKIYTVYPVTAKLALTGNGRTKKPEMVKVAREIYPNLPWDTKPGTVPTTNDETIADALAIGLAGIKKLNGVRRLE